ncbi:S9 family peptidase [Erythrobacter sp. HKB08]|uniref:alpha/beta hydrolase family protein n=1 Tax=Erythrobacter sp. HKB08 TaxID=2502843 RepID=UPI0013E8AD01|nr:S9 family peptidase [Erythrobacter sp. HKB08]
MTGRIFAVALATAGLSIAPQALAQETGAQEANASAATADSKPPIIPTAAFAGRSQLKSAKLSPDGSRMAAMVEVEGVTNVVIFDASTRQPVSKFGIEEPADIEWLRWAGNSKLIVSISQPGKFFGDDVLYTRLFLANIDTGDSRYLELKRAGRRESIVDGDNLIHLDDNGNFALVSMQRTIRDYPSVYRFDLYPGGDISEVQGPKDGVWNWYADDAGVVRLGSGWYRNRLRVYYRSDATGDLEMAAKVREEDRRDTFWEVSIIKSGSDEGYVLTEGESGRVGLRKFDFLKEEVIETVYEHPEWDIDEATFLKGEPFAVYYTDDRERVVWFDEQRKKYQGMLESALKEEQVWITSSDRDGDRMLVYAGGENDPGAMYVLTANEGRLDQFAELRPNIDFRTLARPMAVSYEARDGETIRAYLTLPRGRAGTGLPLIIMPHGGPYGVRDKLEYNDEVQLLANRGYAVLQPNFRGSSGYGDRFSNLGRGQIGRKMQDDLDDAMDWAVAQGVADKHRVCVVGGSYGGYAALWAATRNPERYRCAASWAGVTDLDAQLKYDKQFFSRKGSNRWRQRVEGEEDFDLDLVSPANNAEKLTRPILLAHGKDDSVVPFSQFRKMQRALKGSDAEVTELVIEDEGHSFSKPENEKAWYDALVAFLAKHNPAE